MNCDIVQGLLDSAEHAIPAAVKTQLDAHLAACPACYKVWQLKRLVTGLLQVSPAPPVPDDLGARLLPRIFRLAAQRHRRRIAYATAMAAVLVLGLVLGFVLNRQLQPAPDYAVRSGRLILRSERPTTVQVAFNSAATLDQVQFTIDLPAGMHISGQPGRRHLSWVGTLHKGRNLLELPVVAHAGTAGVMTAKLRRGEARREFTLSVVAVEPAPYPARLWREVSQTLHWQS